MTRDKANLNGKVTVNDITETARKYIPEMRAKGADVVVVVAHSGLSADPYQAMAENSVYYLSGARRGRHYVRPCPRGVPG